MYYNSLKGKGGCRNTIRERCTCSSSSWWGLLELRRLLHRIRFWARVRQREIRYQILHSRSQGNPCSDVEHTPFWVKAEHSTYLTAPNSRASLSPASGGTGLCFCRASFSSTAGSSRRSTWVPTIRQGTPGQWWWTYQRFKQESQYIKLIRERTELSYQSGETKKNLKNIPLGTISPWRSRTRPGWSHWNKRGRRRFGGTRGDEVDRNPLVRPCRKVRECKGRLQSWPWPPFPPQEFVRVSLFLSWSSERGQREETYVVVEDGRDVFRRELVGRVRDQQTSLYGRRRETTRQAR